MCSDFKMLCHLLMIHTYTTMDLDMPLPLVREVTLNIAKWNKCNEKLLLGSLFFDHEH
jgi:hypothetical protein